MLNRRGFLRRATQLAGVVVGAAAVNVLDTALPAQAMVVEAVTPLQALPGNGILAGPIESQVVPHFRPLMPWDLPTWSEPTTWDTYQPVSAAQFNREIRDNMRYLKQALNESGIIVTLRNERYNELF